MLNESYKQKDHIKRITGKLEALRKDIIIHELELACISDHHNIMKLLNKLKKIIYDSYEVSL